MKEKWTRILLISIIIQFVVYALIWFLQAIKHEAILIILFAVIISMIIQIVGYFEILRRAKDLDKGIFSRGRISNKKENLESEGAK